MRHLRTALSLLFLGTVLAGCALASDEPYTRPKGGDQLDPRYDSGGSHGTLRTSAILRSGGPIQDVG
jgi:hypothetical protein